MEQCEFHLPLERERCLWPTEAGHELTQCNPNDTIRRAVLLRRLNHLHAAEANLLSALHNNSAYEKALALDFLAGLAHQQKQHNRALHLLIKGEQALAEAQTILSQSESKPLKASLELRRRQLEPINPGNKKSDQNYLSPLEWLQTLQEQIESEDYNHLRYSLEQWPDELDFQEALELKSRALSKLGRHQEAMLAIDRLLQKSGKSPTAWLQAIRLNNIAGRENGLAVLTASRLHPTNAEIAHTRNAIQLEARQTAAGRRSAFQERLLYNNTRNSHASASDGNLLSAYDRTGCSHLVPFLHQDAWNALEERPMLSANLVMQLASQTHPRSVEACQRLCSTYSDDKLSPFQPQLRGRHLRVALVSPDFGYHPVGRFIQMLLEAGLGRDGELFLVSTAGTALNRTKQLIGQNLIDLNRHSKTTHVQILRDLNLDVAVDLAGWTGNHSASLFSARIAPVQVNYLGYFASTGLAAMDAWLGDQALFPSPMQEWHSETIVRLPRPFIAWNPSNDLPEGTVEVPPGPQGAVTFGCFNHVRKLSASTLKLWAELLEAVPSARLALKAYASDDPGVTELIERRMRRCGLEPARVTWLPTMARPEDHLRQYGLIDIALDPFPNGGCTTTCEALWMGVPVITLCGSHYVERMSTAVLEAAALQNYIATSQDHYLKLAIETAGQVTELRRGRRDLREQVLNSALGDTSGLANELWRCWTQLRQSLAA